MRSNSNDILIPVVLCFVPHCVTHGKKEKMGAQVEYQKNVNKIFNSCCIDGLKALPDKFAHCCVTSPPYYGLRDYGVSGQIGLEETPEDYIGRLVDVFREVRRVLRNDGTFWLNIGDSYAGSGHGYLSEIRGKQATNKGTLFMENRPPTIVPVGLKPKDLIGIPWMLAFSLRADGWYLRQDIIWHKPNPMPESVKDRCTKSHEHIFLLSKSAKYYFDHEALLEPAAYDGRKDTTFKGSDKYSGADTGLGKQSFSTTGHDRWKQKISVFGNKNQTGTKRKDAGNAWTYLPARSKRDVWTVCTEPEPEAHFACFPQKLIVDCIKAGCPEGGIVLDPFMGSGTTAVVARKLNRNYVGFELNAEYVKIAERKLRRELGIFV